MPRLGGADDADSPPVDVDGVMGGGPRVGVVDDGGSLKGPAVEAMSEQKRLLKNLNN